MFTLLVSVIFAVTFFKVAGFILQLAWGAAKIIAGGLVVLTLPALILCILFAGGFALFLPIIMLGAAFVVAKEL